MPKHDPSATPGHGAAYYMLSFMALSTVLIVAAILAGVFWLSRPINLTAETDHLADTLEVVLRDNYIPAQNIQREPPVEQSTSRNGTVTRWAAHNFKVTLPPSLNVDGFKTQLRKDMSTYFVRMTDQERDPATNNDRVSLYLDDLPFAELAILPGKPDPEAQRSDLRNMSDQLANLVATELSSLDANRPFVRQPAEEKADLGALWRYTAFSITLPTGVTTGRLKADLDAVNTVPNVTITTAPPDRPDLGILVAVAGKPCVGITCVETPAGEAPRPKPLTMEAALNGSIIGSEPTEQRPETPISEGPGIVEGSKTFSELEEVQGPHKDPLNARPTREKGKHARNPEDPIRLAIIIDDGGNNSAQADRFLALDNRLTLSILPNTPFASEVAERGAALGFEIMLHMPMETESATEEAVPGTVFTAMGKAEIQELTNKALDQIPNVDGVNNHTGSKFTSNKKKMGFVLEVLKKRGLFFIDSVTINTSVAYQTAQEMGVPTARRNVFLDNDAMEATVRSQFAELTQIARDNGSAIGIGHFQSAATARVLAEEIPKLAESNIQLVHASELVQ